MYSVSRICYAGKRLVLIAMLVILFTGAFSQAPLGINYQGVARNPDGSPQVKQDISLRVSILSEGLNGVVEYVETHAVTTNQFGLFTIVIGQGENTGSFHDVDWQNGNKWLQIEMDMQGGSNFEMVGAQQIFSVPYAMYASQSGTGLTAGDGIDVTGGVISNTKPNKPVSLLGAGTVSVTGTYPDYVITGIEEKQTLSEILMQDNNAGDMTISNLSEPVNSKDVATKNYVDTRSMADADADPTNEIQNLGSTASGAQRTITISGGTGTTIDVADSDNDPVNELQTISQLGNTVTLSNGGGSISVDDGDSDAANELIQSAALTGTNLEITDAGGVLAVDLSSLQDGTGTDSQTLSSSVLTADTRDLTITGGNNITLDVSDNDNSSSNELQSISKTGSTVTLSNGGGSFTDEVDDADADPANEIQNLGSTISGTQRTITITGGTGTTIDVADSDNNASNELQTLSQTGNNITLSNGGGTVSVDDGDSDPANEIQDISLTGNTLSLTNDASPVDLSGFLDNTDNQNLSSTSAGTNRTVNISGGTSITFSVADNDNSTSNELITGATYETNNTLRITEAGFSRDVALGTLNADLNANAKRITNIADPVDPGDAVNLSFLEAKDKTDYAISVGISYTSSGAGDVALDLSGATLDKGTLITGPTITITEDGVYLISVQGYSLLALGSDIDITIEGVGSPVLRGDNNYLGTYLFDLVAGNQIEIIVKFTGVETINLQISVYKI